MDKKTANGLSWKEYFKRRQGQDRKPREKDERAVVALLRACAKEKDLVIGTRTHEEIMRRGLFIKCLDALVTMYATCGAADKAKELFDMYLSRDVFTWTALIAAYSQKGHDQDALDHFDRMQEQGLRADAVTYTCTLQACGSLKAARKGESIHDEIVKQGLLGNNLVLGNALVNMYAKCGALAKAQRVLVELPVRNVISWTALIIGYAEYGEGQQALNCYEEMLHDGLSPNAVTFACILKACGHIGAVDKGDKIHDQIAKQGLLKSNVVLGTALVDMYAKCNCLGKALQVLEELTCRDLISWNALLAGYAEHGEGAKVLMYFERMQSEGFFPDAVTFVCILKACGSLGATSMGGQFHDEIAKQGLLGSNIVLDTALVDMYVKCGAIDKAWRVFEELPVRNAISWTALITGYAEHGEARKTLNSLDHMQLEGLSPNVGAVSCVLSACSRLGLIENAEMYFVQMSTRYDLKPDLEHYACMVDLYGRTGLLDKAIELIEEMPFSSVVVWSSLLAACQKWGDVEVAKWAFQHAVQLDKSDAAIYILMADIYRTAGMQKDAENIEAMRVANRAWKKSTQRW